MTNLKFFYNGIKGSDGKLQKAHYSMGNWATKPASMIRIYGRNYKSFSIEIQEAFKVENGSDMQTDYFEQDHIDVYENHPLYIEVKTAYEKSIAHAKAIEERRNAPCLCGAYDHANGKCFQEVA